MQKENDKNDKDEKSLEGSKDTKGSQGSQKTVKRLSEQEILNIPVERRSFSMIRDNLDPFGFHHDLKLKCVFCANVHSCRCSKPKRQFEGVCEQCLISGVSGN